MPEHPLAAVTAEEIRAVRQAVDKAGLVGEGTRFVYVGLDEPPKAKVLAYDHQGPPQRRFRALLLDLASHASRDVIVDAATAEVVSVAELDTATSGQLPVLDEEFGLVEEILSTDERWLASLRARGIAVENVRVAPLSAGVYADEYPEETGRRLLRGLAFVQEHETDAAWAHPIDGLVAYVDTVNRVIDTSPVPIPTESGNYEDIPPRTTLKPIENRMPKRG